MITRKLIKKAREKSKKYFFRQQKLGQKSSIYRAAKFVLRTNKFSINYDSLFKSLDNIDFIYDPINQHWAETDGNCILLNTSKDYTPNLLTNTLIHEAMHNVIYRDFRHAIPEEKEHKIMELVNPSLISPEYRYYSYV